MGESLSGLDLGDEETLKNIVTEVAEDWWELEEAAAHPTRNQPASSKKERLMRGVTRWF
jgi:hypothetical protein